MGHRALRKIGSSRLSKELLPGEPIPFTWSLTMAKSPSSPILQMIRAVFEDQRVQHLPDRDLLTQFCAQREEAAFHALLNRHGGMVLDVCRGVLGNEMDAEDAFQATFLILAHHAASIRKMASVGNWLHGVAYRTALKAWGRHATRRKMEARAPARQIIEPDDLTWREVRQALHEELSRLSERYRAPLIVCYLEGKTQTEAAAHLGMASSTLKARLERGRSLLRARLVRRGFGPAAILVATAWPDATASASLPAPLVDSTIRAALLIAGGGTASAVVSGKVAALSAANLPELCALPWQLVAAVFLVAGALATGAWVLVAQASATRIQGPTAQDPSKPQSDRELVVVRQDGKEEPRRDLYGDALPPGAMVRLGTVRFRVPGEIAATALAPDGKTTAIASGGQVFLLDAASGKRVKSLPASENYCQPVSLVFSPDGKRLAAKGWAPTKGMVCVWDLDGEGKPREYNVQDAIWLGWSADSEPLAVCAEGGALNLHDLAAGSSRRFAAEGLTTVCAFTPTGKTLAVADEQRRIHVWDTGTGQVRSTIKPKGDFVHSLDVTRDGSKLVCVTEQTVQMWDAGTGKLLHMQENPKSTYRVVRISPDAKLFALTDSWETIQFCDLATGKARNRTEGRSFLDPGFSFSADGKSLVTTERYGSAFRLWDVASGKAIAQPVGHTHPTGGMSFSPDGRRVATARSLDGKIQIWNLATGEPISNLKRIGMVRDCIFSSDGKSLFSAWTDDRLWVSDAASGERRRVIKLEDPVRPDTEQSIISLNLSNDGTRLVVCSSYYLKKGSGLLPDALITGWDAATYKELFRRTGPRIELGTVLSADARVLALCHSGSEKFSANGPMHLEDVVTGGRLLSFPALEGQTWPLSFSPDGRLLASINASSKRGGEKSDGDSAAATGIALQLWETATATVVQTFPVVDTNSHVAFSRDGRLLAINAAWQEILLWDLARGRELRRLKGFDANVTCLAFAPDGRRLISGLSDSTLLVWDVAPGKAEPAPKLGADALTKAWADLATADGPRAFQARGALASSPAAVAFFKTRLRPAQAAGAERLRQLLDDVGSDKFAIRDKAQAELETLGDLAEPALLDELTKQPTLEVKRRVEILLDRLRGPVTQPELLRALRAVAVLEDIGDPAARKLLEELAAGAAGTRLTREAQAALGRLDRLTRTDR
jgi:RNA polymerase sigma factor (sigma-70 family)